MKLRVRQDGFTIVELLIVIVVIGILASITIVAFNGVQARAYDARRDSDISNIKDALEVYRLDNGYYPSACSTGDNTGCSTSYLGAFLVPAYMSILPQDPKTSYSYVRGGVGGDSYAIKVQYETKPVCKTGVNVNTGWWGTGVPVC